MAIGDLNAEELQANELSYVSPNYELSYVSPN